MLRLSCSTLKENNSFVCLTAIIKVNKIIWILFLPFTITRADLYSLQKVNNFTIIKVFSEDLEMVIKMISETEIQNQCH